MGYGESGGGFNESEFTAWLQSLTNEAEGHVGLWEGSSPKNVGHAGLIQNVTRTKASGEYPRRRPRLPKRPRPR